MGAWRICRTVPALVLAAMLVAGCASMPGSGEQPEIVIERGPAPSYDEVTVVVNARAAALERMYSFGTFHVWQVDGEGVELEDQFDVRMMLAQPERVYMRFQLANVEFAILGCDEDEYWWINLRDERRAWLGTHERATPQLMANFMLPIHPQDFVRLMGMTAIPAEQGDASVAWSMNGQYLVVETASRFGRCRMMLKPIDDGYDPARIELFDENGDMTVWAELSKYEAFEPKRGEGLQRVAGEIRFYLASGEAWARLRPHFDGPRKVRDQAFDRERLFEAYKIGPEDVELLDGMMASGAG